MADPVTLTVTMTPSSTTGRHMVVLRGEMWGAATSLARLEDVIPWALAEMAYFSPDRNKGEPK